MRISSVQWLLRKWRPIFSLCSSFFRKSVIIWGIRTSRWSASCAEYIVSGWSRGRAGARPRSYSTLTATENDLAASKKSAILGRLRTANVYDSSLAIDTRVNHFLSNCYDYCIILDTGSTIQIPTKPVGTIPYGN